MKTFRKLGLIGLVAVCLFGFAACGDDDDDDNGGGGGAQGNTQLTISGSNYSLGYAYWFANDYNQSTGEYLYHVEFYSFNWLSVAQSGSISGVPSVYHALLMSFTAQGTGNEIPVGTYAPGTFEISGSIGLSIDNPEGTTYFEEADSNSASLVITKSGNSYTVTLANATFAISERSTTQGSFSYTGSLTELPDNMHE